MSFVYIYLLIQNLLFDAIRSGCHDDGRGAMAVVAAVLSCSITGVRRVSRRGWDV